MSKLAVVLKIVVIGVSIGLAVYLFLLSMSAKDASFFGLVAMCSVLVAGIASPHGNLLLGAKKLWLFDWVAIVGVAAFVVFMWPEEPICVRAVRFLCYCMFFSGGAFVARRGRTARNATLFP